MWLNQTSPMYSVCSKTRLLPASSLGHGSRSSMQLQLIPDRPPLQVINIISGWVSTVFLLCTSSTGVLDFLQVYEIPHAKYSNTSPACLTRLLLACRTRIPLFYHIPFSLDFSQRRTNRKERKPRQSDKYEPCQGPLTPHWACPFTGDFMAEDRASRLATQMDYCHWPRIVHFSGICLPGICCKVLWRSLDRR